MNEVANEEGLDRRAALDEVLVSALASGVSYSQAADAVGVGERTVARRMADVGFARRVSVARGEYVSVMSGRLLVVGERAVEVILGCLDDPDPRVRLAAAKQVLDQGGRFRSVSDLGIEIAELRQAVGLDDGGTGAHVGA